MIELWILLPVAILSAAGGFIAAYLIFGRRKPDEEKAAEDMESSIPVTGEDAERFLSDEERIIKMLEAAGGQMYQTDLVKKTSFSKSKISMALTDMCDKGVIVKVKKGKENLIKLNRPPER